MATNVTASNELDNMNVIGNNQYKYDKVIEPELLISLYYGNQYSTCKIADLFNWNRESIRRRMEKYNIPKRTRGQALSIRQVGDANAMWKGGITKKSRLERNSDEWKIWRESVFERDNYTCQKCMKRGRTLHPHHIKKRCDCPELIFDINNGITLCNSCHTKVHWKQLPMTQP